MPALKHEQSHYFVLGNPPDTINILVCECAFLCSVVGFPYLHGTLLCVLAAGLWMGGLLISKYLIKKTQFAAWGPDSYPVHCLQRWTENKRKTKTYECFFRLYTKSGLCLHFGKHRLPTTLHPLTDQINDRYQGANPGSCYPFGCPIKVWLSKPQGWIWDIMKSGGYIKLFVMFLGLFLNSFRVGGFIYC